MNETEKKEYLKKVEGCLYLVSMNPRTVKNTHSQALVIILEYIKHKMEQEK